MPVVFKVKLGETGNSLRITVPKPIIDGFGWKVGDELEIIVSDKQIELRGPRTFQNAP